MRKLKLSASIMCANLMDLSADLSALERKGFDYLHFDIMDGHFVPEVGLSVFLLEQVTRTQKLPVDVHLMVTDPDRFIDPLIHAGASMICIHQETGNDVRNILRKIQNKKVKTGLALRPETDLSKVLPFLEVLDLVLLMAYSPGIRHQRAATGVEKRIRELCELLDGQGKNKTDVAIDGGVSLAHMKAYRESGANFFVLGSSGLFIPNTELDEQIDRVRLVLDG